LSIKEIVDKYESGKTLKEIGNDYAVSYSTIWNRLKKAEIQMRGPKIFNKGKKASDETRRKMSETNARYWKGKCRSEEDKIKFSNSHKGYIMPKQQRDKIRMALTGEKNPSWEGGKSYEPYTIDWTETLKRSIRERDHYICRLCLKGGNQVHHLNYDKTNCNPDNLITLCHLCHLKTSKNREMWKNFFQNKSYNLLGNKI